MTKQAYLIAKLKLHVHQLYPKRVFFNNVQDLMLLHIIVQQLGSFFIHFSIHLLRTSDTSCAVIISFLPIQLAPVASYIW